MKHQLSFCSINILTDAIAEVTINKDVVVSMEMVEEYEAFLSAKFTATFGLLVNKIHHYHFSYEAKLCINSHANLKAIAVVNYNNKGEQVTKDIVKVRAIDDWNIKSFSGLELGWQQGFDWLKKELTASSQ